MLIVDKFNIIQQNDNDIDSYIQNDYNKSFTQALNISHDDVSYHITIDILYNHMFHLLNEETNDCKIDEISNHIKDVLVKFLNEKKIKLIRDLRKNKEALTYVIYTISEYNIILQKIKPIIELFENNYMYDNLKNNISKKILNDRLMKNVFEKSLRLDDSETLNKYFFQLYTLDNSNTCVKDTSLKYFYQAYYDTILYSTINTWSKQFSDSNLSDKPHDNLAFEIRKFNYYVNSTEKLKYEFKFINSKTITPIVNSLFNTMSIIFSNSFICTGLTFKNKFLEKYFHKLKQFIKIFNDDITTLQFIYIINNINEEKLITVLAYYSHFYSTFDTLLNKYTLCSIKYHFSTNYITTDKLINIKDFIVTFINNNILNKNIDYNSLILLLIEQHKLYQHIFPDLEKNLIKRLLYRKPDMFVEKKFLILLRHYFKDSITHKYETIIKEYTNSKEKYDKNFLKLQLVTTNVWDLNYKDGYKSLPIDSKAIPENTPLYSFALLSTNKISLNNINFKDNNIKLYLHLGFVDITFFFSKNNVRIMMLPIHAYILDRFPTEPINENTFINTLGSFLPNYSRDFIITVLTSFYKENILSVHNDYHNNTLVRKISVNMDYEGSDKINLINTFNKIYYNDKVEKTVKTHDFDEIDILVTIINHYIKVNSYQKKELYNKCMNHKKPFELTEELFDNCIKLMKQKDYIYDTDNGSIIYKF